MISAWGLSALFSAPIIFLYEEKRVEVSIDLLKKNFQKIFISVKQQTTICRGIFSKNFDRLIKWEIVEFSDKFFQFFQSKISILIKRNDEIFKIDDHSI